MRKLKVGDRLICKKELLWSAKNNYNSRIFYVGHNYIISQIQNTSVFVLTDVKKNEGLWFETQHYSIYLWNYFYTEQEFRKYKLEKLAEYESR